MKTLLTTFQDNTDTIGLKYLHSYLLSNNIDSNILFIPRYNQESNCAIKKFLKKFRPKVIGISLMSIEFDYAKEFTAFIKKEFPEIIIAWGGIHASIAPVECLKYADHVFIGESESSYLGFLIAIDQRTPTSKVYRTTTPIQFLEELPFPEHCPESFILDKEEVVAMNPKLFKKYTRYSGKFYSLTTTRGCPFSCAYCCNSFFGRLYKNKNIRKRSVDNVIEELEIAIKSFPDLIYINIQDDNFFSYDPKWMKIFADEFKKKIKIRFVCRTTPAHLTEEKIAILKEAGLSWIFMGLQSGSPRINKEVYKRFVSNKKFIEAAELINKYSIAGFYDVILDNPYEKESDILKTINILLKIPTPFMLQLFSLCFYEGTQLHDRAVNDGIPIENPKEKRYTKYKLTYLNKLVRLTTTINKEIVATLMKNRKKNWARVSVSILYPFSIIFLEPVVWLNLIFISFDRSIMQTLSMVALFFRTGINKVVMRE